MNTKKATKQNKEKQKIIQSTKANRLNKQVEREHGIIYIGHLPYGFMESSIKEYFQQFGTVLGVKIFRSKRTNRTQGYGFVKFEDKEVAQIAAETMNGYLINEKKLVCHMISDQHPDPFNYKHGSRKLVFVNWSQKYAEQSQKDKSDEQIFKEIESLLSKEQEKRQKMKELGINYTYKGYKEQLGL